MTNTEIFYESLNTYKDIEELIRSGETESEYLECKTPRSVQEFDKSLVAKIATIISGFSNNRGGVIILGVDTNHDNSGADVLTQILPIGAIVTLQKRVEVKLPLLVSSLLGYKTKILKEKDSDQKGILLIYIPQTTGDPTQCRDGKFYLRTGEETLEMPYEVIKRMFAGTTDADLVVKFDSNLTKMNDKKEWKLQFSVINNSRIPGKNIFITITVDNPESCNSIVPDGLNDLSSVNVGLKVFSYKFNGLSYRALPSLIGGLKVAMKARKRKLEITTQIFAENMRAKAAHTTVYMTTSGSLRTKAGEHRYQY